MNKMQAQVKEFHEAFGAPVSGRPQLLEPQRSGLRHELIREELKEYETAIVTNDLVEVADALGDLLYVVFGAALEHGVDLEPIVDEIHRSNMSKLGPDGKPILRTDGKILKGEGYTPPNLGPIIEAQQ